jgi:hypothetical protein
MCLYLVSVEHAHEECIVNTAAAKEVCAIPVPDIASQIQF